MRVTYVCWSETYLPRCLLEQRKGSLPQLPLETGVKLEGRGSLKGLQERGDAVQFAAKPQKTKRAHLSRELMSQ